MRGRPPQRVRRAAKLRWCAVMRSPRHRSAGRLRYGGARARSSSTSGGWAEARAGRVRAHAPLVHGGFVSRTPPHRCVRARPPLRQPVRPAPRPARRRLDRGVVRGGGARPGVARTRVALTGGGRGDRRGGGRHRHPRRYARRRRHDRRVGGVGRGRRHRTRRPHAHVRDDDVPGQRRRSTGAGPYGCGPPPGRTRTRTASRPAWPRPGRSPPGCAI